MTEEVPQDIKTTKVDIRFSDPNIRGASGSVFHAGTDEDRGDFLRWVEAGMTDHDATQKLAMRISRRSQRVIGRVQSNPVITSNQEGPGRRLQ